MIELVGHREQRDIRQQAARIFRDLGNPDPPLQLDLVRELLKLDRDYYNIANPGFLTEMAHRVKVAGKQIVARPTLLIEVIKKANLSALWIPDSKRILIDETVPEAKHRWMEAHEIGHSIIPWHREFLFGDNEQTLDPECHATIEAEANFGASRLLFMLDRFGQDAREIDFSFKSVQLLRKRYGNTLTSTFWRFVEDRNPTHAAFGVVGVHPKHPEIGKQADGSAYRYFIRSQGFREQFSRIHPDHVRAIIERHASWRKSGPIIDATDYVVDDTGKSYEFKIESFSNKYDLLTMGLLLRERAPIVSVA